MCGIAGAIHLAEPRPFPSDVLQAMSRSLTHRGPDEEGFFERPGLGLASRRLSIVGLSDGRQPIANEDRSIHVVFNGELFDYREARARLEGRGHQFRTHCDTEVIPHMWEDHQESTFEQLRGQFAVALWDQPRRQLVLGRDRFGICPLFWTRQRTETGEWLLFASEIKALLASGMVEARPDRRGINHAFTFISQPGPVTCFEGIQLLTPGRYLKVQLAEAGQPAKVSEHTFWKMDFPDRGQERDGDQKQLVDEFEQVFTAAVERRLRADVPVVSYLSGGVDSSTVVAVASKIRGTPIPTFTIGIDDPALDETTEADIAARHIGGKPIVTRFGAAETLSTYPRLIEAAEAPVTDTSSAALLLLAQEVHAHGYKVALTGEGADEWLCGYPWYKVHRLLGFLDVIPSLHLSRRLRQTYVRFSDIPGADPSYLTRAEDAVGGPNAWLDFYGMLSSNRSRFFSRDMNDALGDHLPYDDLQLDPARMSRWHPLNRGVFLAGRVHLAGHLLNGKGDRVAMHNSVETRYPFLDEEVFDFLATLHPRWKMKGFSEKHILRLLAERHLPKSIAWRRKAMFRAPFDSFHADRLPPFVDQLLGEDSLKKAGYFDPTAVAQWRAAFRTLRPGSYKRTFLEMGLAGVVATQLWHHTFIDPSLADLPAAADRKAPRPTLAVS